MSRTDASRGEVARLRAELAELRSELDRAVSSRAWQLADRLHRGLAELRSGGKESPPEPSPAAAPETLARYPRLVLPRSPAPIASIVIPVFNQFETTYACLASLQSTIAGTDSEIVLVDDASEDATRHLDQIAPAVRVLRAEENAGFVASCNRGARDARGDYLVFLNNDTEPRPGWLHVLLQTFRDQPNVGAVGPKLVYPDGTLQEAGGIIFSDASGWNYGRGEDPDRPEFNFLRDVDYCSGACLAIPRELFFQLGMFDTRFAPAYYEDTDLCFSVRAAGRRVVVQPLAEVVHHEGKSCGTDLAGGVKRHQVVNRDKFRDKWAQELEQQWESPADERAQRTQMPGASERREGPRVLVLGNHTPAPDIDGESLHGFRLLTVLAGLTRRVTFASVALEHRGNHAAALQYLGVQVLYRPHVESIEAHLQSLVEPYDVVVVPCSGLGAAWAVRARALCPGATLWLDHGGAGAALGGAAIASSSELATPDAANAQGAVVAHREAALVLARACELSLVASRAAKDELSRLAPDLWVEASFEPADDDPADPSAAVIAAAARLRRCLDLPASRAFTSSAAPELAERALGASARVAVFRPSR